MAVKIHLARIGWPQVDWRPHELYPLGIETRKMVEQPDTGETGNAGRFQELLTKAFARQGMKYPELVTASALKIPQPYRSLLVHDSNMTSKLQRHHRDSLSLEVLHLRAAEDELEREVLLRRRGDGKPVEYSVIRIVLASLGMPLRAAILAGAVPLGQILKTFGIEYSSQSREYFQIGGNRYLRQLLGDGNAAVRFGRINTLRQPRGGLLAEAIEILPAMEANAPS